MGEGVYREVLKNPLVACRVYAPVGAHRDLLAYLVRRLLENGANSSFVHQMADPTVDMQDLLTSPLRLEPHSSLPLPPDLFGTHPGARKNSTGLDLTVPSMRDPLLAALAALATTPVPVVPEFDPARTADVFTTCAAAQKGWSRTPVAERAAILRRAADTMLEQTPMFCALLVKEAHKTWGDAVSEVREAVDFLRYYADEAQRIMQPLAQPQIHHLPPALAGHNFGVTGESNTLLLYPRGVVLCLGPDRQSAEAQARMALERGNAVLVAIAVGL
jgi:RHH-type proline utilization regulon transcriptional repressor/proline dehydrogenase/delta 1-pyrroline-5-carboxylate dehydrogenase